MSTSVYFDLDGTIYDLYSMPKWLEMLQNEQEGVFIQGQSCVPLDKLNSNIYRLLQLNVRFGIISWLPMQASLEYEEICRQEKLQWIKENLPFITEILIVPYGTPKQNSVRKKTRKMFLIDDNINVCEMWKTKKQRKMILVNNDFDVIDALEQIYSEIVS